MTSRIQKIEKDIQAYKEAIETAEGALEQAEKELTEELSAAEFDNMEDYPEYEK